MFKSRPMMFFRSDVPNVWIFEHYLNLGEKLTGQTVKIKSVFNVNDKDPSMCIYYNELERVYMFKDFSSSLAGNGYNLVAHLFNLEYKDAQEKVAADYARYLETGGAEEHRFNIVVNQAAKYRVISHEVRGWNNVDAAYWSRYGINSDMLNKYNVRPLSRYTMAKVNDEGQQESFTSERNNIYGYFNKEGELCKIYQPTNTKKKFLKVLKYIQGHDQLSGAKYLIVCSSLKDVMSLMAMGFKTIDAIAPDSENTMLTEEFVSEIKSKYEKVFTLFDDDVAGLKSMMKYQEMFNLPYIRLQMSKDLSDSVRDYGLQSVKVVLYNILKGMI